MSQSCPLLHIKSLQTVLNLTQRTQRSIDKVFLCALCVSAVNFFYAISSFGLEDFGFIHFLPTKIGAVQRGGKVVAQLAPNLVGRRILEFIRNVVNLKDSELITDELRAYELVGKEIKHAVINHSEQYADGETHTNTIEGFWSLFKRAWYGQHHHYQTAYTPLYVAEACYKYNYRETDIFWKFLRESVS